MSDTARPATTGVLSTAEIRSHFPALQREHGGRPVAYFDGPGGTQVPREVVEAVSDYLYHHNANTHWAYPTSAETDEIIERSRQTLADFLGASHEEIVFGANATTLAYHVSRTLGRTFSAGDEVVVTELDHHANVAPWQALARERGVRLRVVRMDTETGQLDWGDFEAKVSGRTRLVAVGAASNALGTINDTSRALRLAREAGAHPFARARLRARGRRDGHAEPRGHRGRGGGRGLPRLARSGRGAARAPARGLPGARRARRAPHEDDVGRALRGRRREALRPAARRGAHADGRLHRARG